MSLSSPMEILLPCTILFLFSLSRFPLAAADDTTALSVFRSQTDIHGILLSNWTLLNSSSGADACSASWRGVRCSGGRVISLTLPSLDLRGPIDALSSLIHLRLLDLHANRLNATLDPIFNCTGLKLLYLSGNDFSGGISPTISSLRRLVRLDLSNNNLRGPIPSEIGNLVRLMTLRLQNNELSGQIPTSLSSIQTLQQLNLTNNEFHGHLPENLQRRFGDQSFFGNAGLCGPNPLQICSFTGTPASSQTVPSNPSSLPASTAIIEETEKRKHRGLSPGAIAAIVISISLLFLAMASFLVAYYCRTRSSETYSQTGSERGGGKRRSSSFSGGEKRVYAARSGGADSDGTTASDRSRLVFYDKKKQFELEDLLRASAEMLGKGSLGTVYKAVLDDGYAVAVKRLKDANPCARKEFEQYMDVIGNLKHPNIVRLRGYYYAKEEKLLVYDYLTNGSLHSLLHGNRGPGRIPLDWTTRISLVLGAARGLSRIHEEYSVTKIPHGNVKSSNILLDKNGVTCISDFGLSLLLNPAHAVARLGGYIAPEQSEVKKLSQKSDVYSFGVLLLEVLTGKLPSRNLSPKRHLKRHVVEEEAEDDEIEVMDLPKWVKSVVRDEWTGEVFDQELLRYKNIEGEMVAMLQVSLACVAEQPDERPTMGDVVKMIEEIRVENSPLAEDYDESRSSMSPSMAATEEGPAGY